MARSITTLEARGRTRVVLNLVKLAAYDTRIEGNNLIVTLKDLQVPPPLPAPASPVAAPVTTQLRNPAIAGNSVRNVDFRRGENGEGRVVVTLPVRIRRST